MKVRFLNYWMKIKDCFFRYSDGLVVLIAVVCLYAILQIKFNFAFWVGYTDNPTAINEVITNLSYSYLAAFVFYILTVTLPHWKMKSKVKMALEGKARTITSNYRACADSVLNINQHVSDEITKEELQDLFKKKSCHQPCQFAQIGQEVSIVQYISYKHNENKVLAGELLEYKPWLDSDTIAKIEKIRNSDIKGVTISLSIPLLKEVLDNEGSRAVLASEVYDLWTLAKTIKP